MATSQMNGVIQHLRGAALLRDGAGLTDGELLENYLNRRDEAPLAAVVGRHGPMVWGVCRRVLRNYHDAEDAFQATFLVLVRKAASIVPRAMVANWLYGVAYQTALKARATAARRKGRERQVVDMPEPAVTEHDLWRDVQPLLDEELSRLPDMYRAVIVLCDLEGKTRKEAARQLGCPEGTVAGRLARARVMLAKRLARHGLTVSGGALAAILAQSAASAGVPNSVVVSTIKATSLFAAGQAPATGVISAKVAALTEGVLKAMMMSKLKTVVAGVLVLGFLVTGAIVFASRTVAAQSDKPAAQSRTRVQTDVKTDQQRLHGAWKLVEMETGGKKLTGKDMTYGGAPLQSLKLFIDCEKLPKLRKIPADQLTDPNDRLGGVDVQFNDNKPHKGDFLMNESKKPKRISMAWLFLYWESIYKLEGDTLTICFNPTTCIRPDEFRTKADSDLVLFVFKRQKPDPDKEGEEVDKRPDLSGTQLPVVPETKKPDPSQEKTDESTPDVRILRGHSSAVYSAAFPPNGETLVTAAKGINVKDLTAASRSDELIIWDVAAQRAKHKIPFNDPDQIWSMTLSADGKTLALGMHLGIELRDTETGKLKLKIKGPWALSTGPCSLAFSPDGKTLATGGSARDNIIRLWNVQTGELTGTLKGHEDAVASLSFSPDGKTLASTGGQYDTTVRYWEVATGRLRLTVKRVQEVSKDGTEAVDGNWQTWPAAFSPDGKILARGRGSEVKFWDARTGAVKGRVIEDPNSPKTLVQSLAFSPDGKLLAGGRDSGDIDVWETRPADGKNDWRIGDLKETLKEHSRPVIALAFSPSGEFLASGDQDGRVRVWKMTKK